MAESPDPGALVGAELVVEDKDKPVGRVTSAAWCPGVGSVCALAYIHRSVAVPGQVLVLPAGADRANALSASVRALPFL